MYVHTYISLSISLSLSLSLCLPPYLPLSLPHTFPPSPTHTHTLSLSLALSLSHTPPTSLSLNETSVSLSVTNLEVEGSSTPGRERSLISLTHTARARCGACAGCSVIRYQYMVHAMNLFVVGFVGKGDWYFIAEQPAPAAHIARPEGRAALTHTC